MKNPLHEHCDDGQLRVVVRGDESSAEFLEAALHLEGCDQCRQRLIEVTADEQLWVETFELLTTNEMVHASHRAMSQPKSIESSRAGVDGGQSTWTVECMRQLLEPPSQPELLGRLDRYEIESVIGSGGMGVVLKAFDTELNRRVAIKLLAPHLAHSGAARQRFAREGRAAAAVMHEHVVAVHNVNSDGNVPYLVMQYVPGQSLQSRVDKQGPLEAKEVLRVGMQAAAGLAAAHAQGLVHRDVKPGNILLENCVERAMLTDFGLARVVDDATLTHTGIVAGTPHYMSPEQAEGQEVDHRSDLFSLGSVLYFAATGRPPFRAERAMTVLRRICDTKPRPVWEINPDLPDEICEIIDRLLEKRPSHRFQDAEQVKSAVSGALSRLQHSAHRARLHRRWRRPFRRRIPLIWTSTIVLLLLLIAGGTWIAFVMNGTFGPAVKNQVDRGESVPSDSFEEDLAAARAELERILRSRASSEFQDGNIDSWESDLGEVNRDIAAIEARLH